MLSSTINTFCTFLHKFHVYIIATFWWELCKNVLLNVIFGLFSCRLPLAYQCLLSSSFHLCAGAAANAVTNLLAEPPRAPCGGASSPRACVIDWTWGKRCQAGHHRWISRLIINSLLPGVPRGDTSVTRYVFMTHGTLDYYSGSGAGFGFYTSSPLSSDSTAPLPLTLK